MSLLSLLGHGGSAAGHHSTLSIRTSSLNAWFLLFIFAVGPHKGPPRKVCLCCRWELCSFPVPAGKALGAWDGLSAQPTHVLLVLLARPPILWINRVVCHSHPAPGAFGVVLLSAAPQIHSVHPTQHVYKHAAHSLQWGCSMQFAFQWLGSRAVGFHGLFYSPRAFTNLSAFLARSLGQGMPAKNLRGKRTTCTAYLAERGIIPIPGPAATTANACAQC